MPEITNPRELFLHELGDILYVERKLADEVLPKLIEEVSDEEFRSGLETHLEQTRRHVDNVENVFKALGEPVEVEECIGFEGLKSEHDNDLKFLKQIGHPLKGPADSADTTLLGRPAGLEIDEGAHELYISDGYLNKRVIVFDSDTLAFKRMWGGYGNAPNDADPGPYKGRGNAPIDQQFRSPVHCAHISKDGLVYVCDRSNDRVQAFTKQGKFLKEFFVRPETLEPGTVCDIAFSHDAGQEYLLIADDTNNVIWTLRRSDGTVLGMMGHDGRNAGQFHAIHQLVSDSAGNLYSGEVETGKRIQKFLLVSGPTNGR